MANLVHDRHAHNGVLDELYYLTNRLCCLVAFAMGHTELSLWYIMANDTCIAQRKLKYVIVMDP